MLLVSVEVGQCARHDAVGNARREGRRAERADGGVPELPAEAAGNAICEDCVSSQRADLSDGVVHIGGNHGTHSGEGLFDMGRRLSSRVVHRTFERRVPVRIHFDVYLFRVWVDGGIHSRDVYGEFNQIALYVWKSILVEC